MQENEAVSTDRLRGALAEGDPAAVLTLIQAGADIHSQVEHGYNAFLDAVHGRDVLRDPRLLDLLRLLIDAEHSGDGRDDFDEGGARGQSLSARPRCGECHCLHVGH